MTLIRVVAPHFVAGIETDGKIRRAAPILAYTIGWADDRARTYFKSKGWVATRIPPATLPPADSANPAEHLRPATRTGCTSTA